MIAVLIGMKLALMAYSIVTKSAAAATAIFNAVLFLNPIGLIVVAIAAVVAGLIIFRKEIQETFAHVKEFFSLSMPDWLQKGFGGLSKILGFAPALNVAKAYLDPGSPTPTPTPGVAAQAAQQQKSIVDTNVTITAPPGVVQNATTRTSGTVPGNRGLIMAN